MVEGSDRFTDCGNNTGSHLGSINIWIHASLHVSLLILYSKPPLLSQCHLLLRRKVKFTQTTMFTPVRYHHSPVLKDSTLTVQQHSLPPPQLFCRPVVWKLAVPGHQESRRRPQRSTPLFQSSPPWGLHILGCTKPRTAERRKSGRCEFLQKHPCDSLRQGNRDC